MKSIHRVIPIALSIVLFCGMTSFAYAKESGLLTESIWYSDTNFEEGKTVTIHTALWNGESTPLSATVQFTDKDTILGSREVTVAAQTLKDVSISWKVTAGDHQIGVKVVKANTTLGDSEETSKKITVSKKDVKEVVPSIEQKIEETIPDSVSEPVSNIADTVDIFREENAVSFNVIKKSLQEDLEELKEEEKEVKGDSVKTKPEKEVATSPLDGAKKPLLYVRIFVISLAYFIFNNPILFYGLALLLLFLIGRRIYRKFRR